MAGSDQDADKLRLCSVEAQALAAQLYLRCNARGHIDMSVAEISAFIGHDVSHALAELEHHNLFIQNGHGYVFKPRITSQRERRIALATDWNPSAEHHAIANRLGLPEAAINGLRTKFVAYYTKGLGVGLSCTPNRWTARWKNWATKEAERLANGHKLYDDPAKPYIVNGRFSAKRYREWKNRERT